MVTLVFKVNFSTPDQQTITALQQDYARSFRKLYNNLELAADKPFLQSLRVTSTKQREYLVKEVLAFHDRNLANKERIKTNIIKLESLTKPYLKQFRQLQYLRKSLPKPVCFGDKKELIKLSKGTGDLTKWQQSRLLPLVFYGETARKGNRFFDLSAIATGQITFKMEGTKFKATGQFKPKKHQAKLTQLQSLANQKKVPITVKLTSDKLYLTYDESLVNKTNVDIKAFYQTITNVKSKTERTALIAARHEEHRIWLKRDKLDRYLSIDLNPDGVGYAVLNRDLTIIDKGFIDVSKLYNADKRRYETSIMVKELFKILTHYRCHSIITEELEFKDSDLGNKVSNRKVNNLWNRGLIKQIIERKCNELGLIHVKINPLYTSFIGNLMHDEYDPIAASLEIGRRGMNKFSKGGFYPEFCSTTTFNLQTYVGSQGCNSWIGLYKYFVTTKRSYRRKLDSFSFVGHYLGNERSGVQHLRFV